jgi:uncharacterized protein (DUF433 family)
MSTAKVSEQERLVTCSPEIMSGTPVFAGTRVPIKNLWDYLEGGQTLAEFLDDFPTVTREQSLRALREARECLLEKLASD